MFPPVFDTPSRLEDLSQPERLLVFGLRAMATGHGDCPALAQSFDRLCGKVTGHAALQAYFAVVKLVGITARRHLKVHTPGCGCLSLDETAVVGVVAAAQRALEMDDDGLLRMRLAFLVKPQSAETVRCAALAMAKLLMLSDLDLPVRFEDPDPRRAAPGPLHAIH